MRSNSFLVVSALCCAVTSFFCAGQILPPGGPPDLTPPVILESTPKNGDLFFREHTISLTFNKYVDRTSLQQSCYISPPPGRLNYEWSAKEVEISFSEELRESTTYVLTIGTDLKDTRNNRLAFAYSLAFSTGGHIDSADIAGQVAGPKPEGVMIYAYRIGHMNQDTLNPTHYPPDYLTQSGSNGLFELSNLALGKYRVIAVREQYKNLLYDVQTDEYGVFRGDVNLDRDHRTAEGITFRLTKEDTTPPFISSAKSIDNRHVAVKFSEPMRLGNVGPDNFIVEDTSTAGRLGVMEFAYVPSAPAEGTLTVAPQESLHVYRLLVRGPRDIAGNGVISGRDNGVFTASMTPDTLKPISGSDEIADSAKNIRWDDTLKFSFTKAIDRRAFERGSAVLDAAGSPVACVYEWSGSSYVGIVHTPQWKFGAWYTINIRLDSVRDYRGAVQADSMWRAHFRIVEEKKLGSVRGKVIDRPTGGAGKIRVTAEEIVAKLVSMREVVADSAGKFEFPSLEEGKYVFSAFRDADGNGAYSYGKVYPFTPSERFAVHADTVKIRARWPVEGIVLTIE